MLNIDKIFSLVSNFVGDGELYSNSKKKKVMQICIENVVQEIAQDYSNCVHKEKINISNGQRFYFDSLSKTIIGIRNLYKNGYPSTFKLFNDGIEVGDSGEYLITYNYLPVIDFELDCIEGFSPNLTNRVVSYGVAAEYLLSEARYDEASLWDSRFRESLKTLSRSYTPKRIRRRAWF